ncbi:RmlC-like cupin [Mycena sanguinolenta]|uniref:RmlC-like cupin n=1 Tax=Mycena sanguinolenta TaxID=230812 RepID=A0A8H6Z8G2_9AGAR|nr:RmlC-like cupin [Mycena sanguinolenta]
MQPKASLYVLISLLPVYISLGIYFNLIALPSSAEDTLSSLLKLANSNLRKAHQERGHADHDWLKTFHTFSFASYQDNKHSQFGALRVINEDRVAPRTGFGTHSHREFEIFSYVVAGQLEHKDSMGNTEILKRGDLQLTSAGTGISHSEKAYGSKQVHFLQIWSLPSVSRLQPKYFTRHFTDAEKRDAWARIVAPVDAEGVLKDTREGAGPAPVQSPLTPLRDPPGYIHVVQTSGYKTGAATGATIKVIGAPGVEVELKEGDGAYLHFDNGGELTVENVGDRTAEVLLFDLE